MKEWVQTMEQLVEEIESLFGVHITWKRQSDKYMTVDELLCPVITTLTTEMRDSLETCFEDDSDYEEHTSNQCCITENQAIPRAWITKKDAGDKKMRLLMWNPENLAQRLDLDNAVSKGKQVRRHSPPLRSARES